MAIWDGLAVDSEAAKECGDSLKEVANLIGSDKTLSVEDNKTTITANSRCTQAAAGFNEICGLLGDYLNIDKSNLSTIVETIITEDGKMAESYAGGDSYGG